MDILIIDRDPLVCQLMTTKLEQAGHRVVCEENKALAMTAISKKWFDCIFIDPAPLKNVRPFVFDILKKLGKGNARPYIVLLSKDAVEEDAIAGFCNNVLRKPFDHRILAVMMKDAQRLAFYTQQLNNNDKDIENAQGIIDQRAFQQLFLASIDRGFRYSERNFILFVTIRNIAPLQEEFGDEDVAQNLLEMGEKISWMRRQSDVIGRVAPNIFGVLLQRPMYDTEIDDAFSRFQEKIEDMRNNIDMTFDIHLSVIGLPFGGIKFETGLVLTDSVNVKQ